MCCDVLGAYALVMGPVLKLFVLSESYVDYQVRPGTNLEILYRVVLDEHGTRL